MSLPRYFVLKCSGSETYLGPETNGNEYNGYAEFREPTVVSPNAKFEVEYNNDGLVHIRSCANNKYLERNAQCYITVTAKNKEEDRSNESCTLFEPILEDSVYNNFRFVHVQSGCYLCLWPLSYTDPGHGILAYYTNVDDNGNDIFKVIDWGSLVILPRFVAFKGNNGHFLRLIEEDGYPYLQFSSDDAGDPNVAMEVFYMKNGDIRLKPVSSDKFWRRSPNWIWADSESEATDRDDNDTLFRAYKVDSQTIALLNLGNHRFCKRLTTEGKNSCLNAEIASITHEAYLTVEEPVLSREIENVRYYIDQSRVYSEEMVVVASNSACNHTNESNKMDVKLAYEETNTRTWQSHLSLHIEAKASVTFGIPLIVEGNVELSSQYIAEVEWGETKVAKSAMEVTLSVPVPAMTKVTVKLVKTHGKCDVPFRFTQKDTLFSGKVVSTEVQGSTYTGSNYYNAQFDVVEEPLDF